MDSTTHLLLTRSEARERHSAAEAHALALRLVRLRRLDRRARSAGSRARLARLAVG